MHMEQFWKTTDERLIQARKDIYTMIDEIMSVYWLDNRGVAIIMAYSDEMDTKAYKDKDSWTSIGCSYFRNWIEDVNDDAKVKEVAQKIDQNDVIWILRWTKELNNALVRIAEKTVTKDIPDELANVLKWVIKLIWEAQKEEQKKKPRAKKKKQNEDEGWDILWDLNKLLR